MPIITDMLIVYGFILMVNQRLNGGQEFLVILPLTNEEGAIVFAKKIRIAIENLSINHEQSTISKVVTTSIGVVTLEPKLLTSPEEAIIYADKQCIRQN